MIVSTDFCYVSVTSNHDLFDEVKLSINLVGGTLSADDTVIDKPHSDPKLTAIFWLFLFGTASSYSQGNSVNYFVLHGFIW